MPTPCSLNVRQGAPHTRTQSLLVINGPERMPQPSDIRTRTGITVSPQFCWWLVVLTDRSHNSLSQHQHTVAEGCTPASTQPASTQVPTRPALQLLQGCSRRGKNKTLFQDSLSDRGDQDQHSCLDISRRRKRAKKGAGRRPMLDAVRPVTPAASCQMATPPVLGPRGLRPEVPEVPSAGRTLLA